jgi:hypothetical protein
MVSSYIQIEVVATFLVIFESSYLINHLSEDSHAH